MRRRPRSAAGLAVVLALSSGCGPSEPATPAKKATAASGDLATYLPLENDTVAQFESFTDGGDPAMFVLEISRPRPQLAELSIAGRVQRLLIDEQRIQHATGGTLLELPLAVGHSFSGSFGRVTIVETDRQVTVPAGSFARCIVTVEESTKPPRRATSVYCPERGLVELTVESGGADAALVENRLLFYGPRFK